MLLFALLARALAAIVVAWAAGTAGTAHSRAIYTQSGDDGITIAQQPLYRGCNDVVVLAPLGTAWSAILAHVQDQTLVVGLWKHDNQLQRYRAEYFSNALAPLDGDPSTTEAAEGVWFCVSANTSIG